MYIIYFYFNTVSILHFLKEDYVFFKYRLKMIIYLFLYLLFIYLNIYYIYYWK